MAGWSHAKRLTTCLIHWDNYGMKLLVQGNMSNIEIKIPHFIGQEEALKRIKNLITNLKEEHSGKINGVKEDWSGQEGSLVFSARGFQVSGKIYVGVDTVRISSRLPFVLSFYKNTITKTIWAKGTELLHHQMNVENTPGK